MARPVRTERDKIAAKARKLCADPLVRAEWNDIWSRVLDQLHASYSPAMKSFEAHHSNEVAREAMLRALVAGKPAAECEAAALASVGVAP